MENVPETGWIADVLSTPAGYGSYPYNPPPDLAPVEPFTTSWACGTGAKFRSLQYTKKFGVPPPRWILGVHPYHQMLLCRGAIEREELLPESQPR